MIAKGWNIDMPLLDVGGCDHEKSDPKKNSYAANEYRPAFSQQKHGHKDRDECKSPGGVAVV